ncbi:MAG: alpha/beta hydrolase [Tannerella sp.]|jgi:acetyl esterase/lipase|nr:alpha/beta hydrolase [Tannerella sp.]
MKKKVYISLCVMSLFFSSVAQEKTVRLFPAGAPGVAAASEEVADESGNRVAGETVLRITNVSVPAITVYDPSEEVASGSAVIVCPGGGYSLLAYDLEGDEVCLWLNELGITAILLKYRVPQPPEKEKYEAPLQDLQRALSYVRANAKELNLDADRIGVMGFSAGAHLSVMACNSFDRRTYPPVDEADRASCRPNFCLLVYPAYLAGEDFRLAPEIQVSSKTPPTMLIHTADDRTFINSSLFYYYALKEAGVPVWMHLYHRGGHGYGLRDTGAVVNSWPDRAEDWFREIGIID